MRQAEGDTRLTSSKSASRASVVYRAAALVTTLLWTGTGCVSEGTSARPAGAGLRKGAHDAVAILADYRRAERFASLKARPLVFRAGVEPHWIGKTARFWYRNDLKDAREFVLVDAEEGARRPAFDHARLAAALSEASGHGVEAAALPFDTIHLDEEGRSIRFEIDGDGWRCDLGTYRCEKTPPPKREPKPGPKKRDAPGGKKDAGRGPGLRRSTSPDGGYVASIRDHNLNVKVKATGEELRLTTDGVEARGYGSFSWSPDSRRLVAFASTPGEEPRMHMIESAPKDGLRPKLHSHVYRLPGDRVATHEMWVFDVEKRKATRVRTGTIDWGGPPRIRWRPDGKRFLFERTHRAHARVRVIEVDSETGDARTVIDEDPDTFVDPGKRFARYLDGGREIVWMSERDGWNHLYLIDGHTGEVKGRITRGEWAVRRVERVDEDAREVLFAAGGREPGRDPYLVHYYRAGFDGTGLTLLTPGNGTHKVAYSPGRRFFIDTYSRADMAPVTELRRAADGSLVCELERADASALLETGWTWPEVFSAKGRDGTTDIWGVIVRPSGLGESKSDETRKYPVIESIYAGPQGARVPKAFGLLGDLHALAELGFVAVAIDGMGTSHRSKAFHDVCYRDLRDGGFPDRIAWLRAAAARYPHMDLSRVGIYGASAGGYNAARALLDWPGFYKVGISLWGNHDHRTDKTWWNELWMGYPVGEHYREQSNVTDAHKLRGRLLLIHGELDRNVNAYASTMQLVDALVKADRDFDMLLVPGAGHGTGLPHVKRRQWDYFVRHLRGAGPPADFRFEAKPRAGENCKVTFRNALSSKVSVSWIDFSGRLKRYHVLAPGKSVKQNTYVGHEWVAKVYGRTVARYVASVENPQWVIGRQRDGP